VLDLFQEEVHIKQMSSKYPQKKVNMYKQENWENTKCLKICEKVYVRER